MRGERKIVIGYNPRTRGADALALGRVLAEVLAATPLVVTVSAWPANERRRDDLDATIERELAEPFGRAREALEGLEPEVRAIPHNSPAAALQEVAETEPAVAIVLGSSHRGILGRTLVGSVGESLLQGAPCAVAVAPAGYADREAHKLARMAAAYDGSPEARVALDTATALAERTHAQLRVVTVAEYPRYGFGTALSILGEAEYRDAELEHKRKLLDEALEGLPAELGAIGELESGDPGSVLGKLSGEADLVVCGSRGFGPLRRTLLGSTTRSLLADAKCPVLVLARGVKVEPVSTPPQRASGAER